MQSAGGVGGLLIVNQPSTQVAFVAYDGNGNVSALVNAANGLVLANYEYGPFGELIRKSGPFAAACPFRFSTKYQDDESDLIIYPFRVYNSSTGRWLSRDRLGEKGGFNLYGFVSERPTVAFDPFGLDDSSSTVGGSWSALLTWLLGNPQDNYTLSTGLEDAITSDPDLVKLLMAIPLKFIHCKNSGTFPLVYNDGGPTSGYAIPGEEHMGKFQLKVSGNCNWSCGVCRTVAPCSCQCGVTCNLTFSISKTYTFQPWGFNDENASFITTLAWLIGNGVSIVQYGSPSGYYISDTFSHTYNWRPTSRCTL
jgi:RHS repeat-associated protein